MAAQRGFGAAAAAGFVLDRYEEVIEVNPSNIQAWANTGYLHWMIGNTAAARKAYARRFEYKEIARQTVVSELRFGLARICAEEAKLAEAYRYCLQATPEKLIQGINIAGPPITPEIIHRE